MKDSTAGNQKNKKVKLELNLENIIMIVGSILSLGAISLPFLVIYINKYEFNLITFESLGTVGDYFGGTTVGLLSLASLLFVTAAMIMQKKELKLQRTEISMTRKEFEISNNQLLRTLFETKFFNMIDIHYKIISELKYKDYLGREVLEEASYYFRNNIQYHWSLLNECPYDLLIIRMWEKKLKDEKPVEFYKALKYFYNKHEKTDELDKLFQEINNDNILEKRNDIDTIYRKTIRGENVRWLDYFSDYKTHLQIGTNLDELNDLEKEFSNYVINNSSEVYYLAFTKRSNQISHYYTNFFNLVGYIEEFDFYDNNNMNIQLKDDKNQSIKKEYYNILFSQLTPLEFHLLSDHAMYYEDAKKYKEKLENIGFIDKGKYGIDIKLFNLMVG